MNIIKKPCNLQKTTCLKFRDRKNMTGVYMCVYGYISVCAILAFYFSNFITYYTFLRRIPSKKKYSEGTSYNFSNSKLQSMYHFLGNN